MIVKNNPNNVDIQGDITEHKLKIEAKNLEHIITLLSSNLYSHPEQSFLREIVSNAWDAQVEAGTTDIPILIYLDWDNNSITIRDYGTGLSPERFSEIYCSIGSSTKRENNEYIGYFGIGRFSSLACSDCVYIDSYYEGILYQYLMVKSGNSITINLLNESETTEKNGVAITLKNVYLYDYSNHLFDLLFFPNIYIENSKSDFNDIRIKHFNKFAFAETSLLQKILIGNVLYPLTDYKIVQEISSFYYNIKTTGITVKFDIGELEITPNRENIIYNDNTREIIINRFKEAQLELESIIETKSLNYTNFKSLSENFYNSIYYNPITDTLLQNCFNGYYYKTTKPVVYYRNIKVRHADYSFIKYVFNDFPIKSIYNHIRHEQFSKTKNTYLNTTTVDYILLIPDECILSATLKNYIKNKYSYNTVVILSKFSYDLVLEYAKNSIQYKNEDINEELLKVWYDNEIESKIDYLDPATDPDYLEYKETLRLERKSNKVVELKDTILYWHTYYYNKSIDHYNTPRKCHYTDVIQVKETIKSAKSVIWVDNIHPNNSINTQIAVYLGFHYVTANKTTVSKLQNLGIKKIITTEDIKRSKVLYNKYLKFIYDYEFHRLKHLLDIGIYQVQKYKDFYDSFVKYDIKPLHVSYTYLEKVFELTPKQEHIDIMNNIRTQYTKYIKALELFKCYNLDNVILFLLNKDNHINLTYSKYDSIIYNNDIIKWIQNKLNSMTKSL